MNSKCTDLIRIGVLGLLANRATFGQPGVPPRTTLPVITAPGVPIVTILSTPTGALLRSQGTGNASVDLGRVSYFKGTSTPGQSILKNFNSFVISTRFGLRVDCPGSPAFSQVTVTMSRMDSSVLHAIAIDGARLGSAAQTLAAFMACGSAGEHRLDVEIPTSTPAGSIGSTVAFVATLRR